MPQSVDKIRLTAARASTQDDSIAISDADIQEFLELVNLGFERSLTQSEAPSCQQYQVGPHGIRLRYAHASLERYFGRALGHLHSNGASAPDLTIHIWESPTAELPLLLSGFIDLLGTHWWRYGDSRGELVHYSGGRLRAAFYPYPNRLSVLDLDTNTGYLWVEDAQELPYHEIGSSCKVILHWWLAQQQIQLVHAGAVGTEAGGVLIAGPGGSGKSTTCLTCLGSPLGYASDDYSLVALSPTPTVYSLYNTAKLKGPEDIARFPHLKEHISNRENLDTEKATLFVHEVAPQKVMPQFPLKALLIPTVTGKPDTTYQPLSPGKALMSLSISTIFQLPGAHKNALGFMAAVARSVPCYRLNLGTRLAEIPDVIAEIIEAS